MLRLPLILTLLLASAPAGAEECGSVADGELPPEYLALVSAQALIGDGEPQRAYELLEPLEELPPGPAARRAQLLAGRALIEIGDLAGGRTILNTLLASIAEPGHRPEACDADPGEVRWWLAEGAVLRGAPQAAVPVWQRIWARNPSSDRADDARAMLARHLHPVPDPDTAAGRELIHERAGALQRRQRHPEALALLETLPDDGTDKLRRAVAKAAFRARQYQRAVDLFGTLKSPSDQDRFDRALAASRTGDYSTAATLYEALVADHADDAKKPPQTVDTASFKLGYLAYDEGGLERGIGLFSAHLQRYPCNKHAAEALWFKSWS
jgi:hypothetical protein